MDSFGPLFVFIGFISSAVAQSDKVDRNLTGVRVSAECVDWNGQQVQGGELFVAFKDAPCILCWCEDGLPQRCITQECDLPQCDKYERIEGECCKVNCLDSEGRPYNFTMPVESTANRALVNDLVTTLQQCCNIGTTWNRENGGECPEYPTGQLGTYQTARTACKAMIEICCLHERKMNECDKGLTTARAQQSCGVFVGVPGNEDASECCHCCRMGFVAQLSELDCGLFDAYSQQCSSSFRMCCDGSSNNETRSDQILETEISMCERYKGQLCAHICIPTPGSYRCTCREGSVLHSDGRSCVHMSGNKCDIGHPCEQTCTDTGSQVVCGCHEGFALNNDRVTCSDVDECLLNPNVCVNPLQCTNTIGSYTCDQVPVLAGDSCQPGFAYNTINGQCEDIDECIINRHACISSISCENTPGSYICVDRDVEEEENVEEEPEEEVETYDYEYPDQDTETGASEASDFNCGSGFRYNIEHNRCDDINECDGNKHRCTRKNQICRNSVGSYTCMCAPGFHYNPRAFNCEDVDECNAGTHTCSEQTVCKNTPGSYTCEYPQTCEAGFSFDQDQQGCVDDDECALGTHNCPRIKECNNTWGSFRCDTKRCPQHHKLDFRTGDCLPISCPVGHRPDPRGNCIDINECSDGTHMCNRKQRCHNTIGSYKCRSTFRCPAGYKVSEIGTGCEDINECTEGSHDCTAPLMQCANRPGTYMCQCPEGYQMNHNLRRCDDIDECARYSGNVCSTSAICQNTPGSYRCSCKDGFQKVRGGNNCEDIDECRRAGLCQHGCRNTWGTYVCTCNEGYQLASDGRTCEDIDECIVWAQRGGELCAGVCRNTPGSYQCSCPQGYQMSADRKTCEDIDECSQRRDRCRNAESICVNIRGSFRCQSIRCPAGFMKAALKRDRPIATQGYRRMLRHLDCRSSRRCRRALQVPYSHQNLPRKEDDSVVCQRMQCNNGNVACLMNKTKSIQWQFVSLPTVTHLVEPMILLNVHAIGYTVFPNLMFSIISGNEDRMFDVIKKQGSLDKGALRLLKPVRGPQEYELTLQMDNRNRLNYVISSHLAHVTVYVAPHMY